MQPRVTVTDELGYIYEADESGEYRRTHGMMQKLDAAQIIKHTGDMSERDKQIARAKYDPCKARLERRLNYSAATGACKVRVLC